MEGEFMVRLWVKKTSNDQRKKYMTDKIVTHRLPGLNPTEPKPTADLAQKHAIQDKPNLSSGHNGDIGSDDRSGYRTIGMFLTTID